MPTMRRAPDEARLPPRRRPGPAAGAGRGRHFLYDQEVGQRDHHPLLEQQRPVDHVPELLERFGAEDKLHMTRERDARGRRQAP